VVTDLGRHGLVTGLCCLDYSLNFCPGSSVTPSYRCHSHGPRREPSLAPGFRHHGPAPDLWCCGPEIGLHGQDLGSLRHEVGSLDLYIQRYILKD
jgi:hypothetical protein